MGFSLLELYLTFIVLTIFLPIIEFFLLKFQNRKKQKIMSLLFNWNFPSNKPFTLFFLPVMFFVFLEILLLKQTFDLYTFLFITIFFSKPLAEEIIFRGMIFGYFLQKFCSKKQKKTKFNYILKITFFLILQSLIFTSGHWESKLFAIPSIFFSGIVYGLLFLLSDKNVLLPTIAHLAVNFSVFFFSVALVLV